MTTKPRGSVCEILNERMLDLRLDVYDSFPTAKDGFIDYPWSHVLARRSGLRSTEHS